MTVKAKYSWTLFKSVLCIEDWNDGAMSVTNDMENVLGEIGKEVDLEGRKIVYKDSNNIWDGVRWDQGVVTFYSIGELTQEGAVEKVSKVKKS